MYAIFNSSFTTYLEDFVDVVIVWIAPWVGHLPGRLGAAPVPLRAGRAAEDRTGAACTGARAASSGRPSSPRWSACSPPSSALSATFHLPHWLNEVTVPHRGRPPLRRRLQRLHWAWPSAALVYLVLACRTACASRPTSRTCSLKAEGLALPAGPHDPAGPQLAPASSQSRPAGRRGSGRKSGMRPEGADQVGVRSQGAAPTRSLGHQGADHDRFGARAPDEPQRGQGRGAGRDDVVDHRHPATPHRRTRAGSMRSRCGVSVVMEVTGSDQVSPRWILGVLCRIT